MRTVFLDVDTMETLIDLDIGAVAPNLNDIIVYPDKGEYRVIQRAFILTEQKSTVKIIDLKTKRSLEPVLQLAIKRLVPATPEVSN